MIKLNTNRYKGIILAGGSGTRLYPSTNVISKQLLSVYDKPMIYYPLSVLMLADIRDILIISTPQDIGRFEQLLGDGSNFGIKLSYQVQHSPQGLAHAFIVAEEFLDGAPACLILGDNIFYGNGFTEMLTQAQTGTGATIFTYQVSDPERYGVAEFDHNNKVLSIEEKPTKPKSQYAVTGIYFYDNQVVKYSKQLKPSKRGELEITDLNNLYLEHEQLHVINLKRGFAWLDTGTHDSMLEAANFIQTVEHRQGIKIACLEEIAYNSGWLSKADLQHNLAQMGKSSYAKYLYRIIGD
jgi:glucose-1-phosphate thymidylyltransferase